MPDHTADEKAIRATAEQFTKAFNAANVKAVGALWATDAEYTDESGQSFQGREAIEKEYADCFQQHPGAAMTVTIESIRFLGPDIAVEKGIAKVKAGNESLRHGTPWSTPAATASGSWSWGGTRPTCRARTKIS